MASGTLLAYWSPVANEPPASNAAVPGLRNSQPTLDFDDTTDEEAIVSGVMPNSYVGVTGVTVILAVAAADTTVTPHNMVFQAAFERQDDDAHDIDADGFAAFQSSGAVQEASASGEPKYISITFTNGAQMDSIAVGDRFRLKIRRDADNTSATDSLTGDAQLIGIWLKET